MPLTIVRTIRPQDSLRVRSGEALIHALFMPLFVAVVPMHVAVCLHSLHTYVCATPSVIVATTLSRGWADSPILGLVTMVTHHDMHHEHAPQNFGSTLRGGIGLMEPSIPIIGCAPSSWTPDNESRSNLE